MFFIKRDGWIEMICGCMFSGKSEELIRRIKRARIARMNVQIFKPVIDNRYSESQVVSHTGKKQECVAVESSQEIMKYIEASTNLVAIDEVQFFDEGIVDVCRRLADDGIRVVCAGLDQDFRGMPFGPAPQLLSIAEYITKLHAICVKCGDPATRTQRLINGEPANYYDPVILVGATEAYEARCRHCHEVPGMA